MSTATHAVEHKDIYNFVLAGKASFTMHNIETDGRFTYKVNKMKKGTGYFISVSYGYEQYTYAGMLVKSKENVVEFIKGKKGKMDETSDCIQVLVKVIRLAVRGKLPDNIEVLHFNKCGRCNRPLTDPVSIKRGIGPECIKLINKDN